MTFDSQKTISYTKLYFNTLKALITQLLYFLLFPNKLGFIAITTYKPSTQLNQLVLAIAAKYIPC